MKDWGEVGKNFLQPDSNAFYESKDCMDQIKCKIAALEAENPETTNDESSEAKTPESADQTANTNPESVTQPDRTVILQEECEADKQVT